MHIDYFAKTSVLHYQSAITRFLFVFSIRLHLNNRFFVPDLCKLLCESFRINRIARTALKSHACGCALRYSLIDHPRLNNNDAESIRLFRRGYDNYVIQVQACAESHAVDVLNCWPVTREFFYASYYVYSFLELGLLNSKRYDLLQDLMLPQYLEWKSTENRDFV